MAIVTKERDSFQSQLEETKHQVEIQASRFRTLERNLQIAQEKLEEEQLQAQKYLSQRHISSPHVNNEIKRLDELLSQARLRQAEMGKINATQLDEINTLNRHIKRLEGELEVLQQQNLNVGTGSDRTLPSQLTLAKSQLADVRAQLSQQEREFKSRLEEHNIKNKSLVYRKIRTMR